ncbi:MAG: chromate efflux transporter [Acidimicrobiales bacterium]
MNDAGKQRVPLATIAREWGRIGIIGFGGPPAHISLMRQRFVEERGWLAAKEFEDGIAATNLLPGPASTQLSIFCAWTLRGAPGAVVGGLCFIAPGLTIILVLATVFLAAHPPLWIEGAAAGAGAAVPAVALQASLGLVPGSWKRASGSTAARIRWVGYLASGCAAAATAGPLLVLVLLACGLFEIALTRPRPLSRKANPRLGVFMPLVAPATATGGLAALAWVAFKVGALSYGGGFVIIPLMQHDAVSTYHWMSATQFLNAVALGQITPGPVVQTVAVVGYAAAGVLGGLLAAAVAFVPSFIFIIGGASHFDRLRHSPVVQSFLTGAGAAAIGAIAGSSVPLGLALGHLWQVGVLALALLWLLILKKATVPALLGAGALGVIVSFVGAPIPR